MNVVFMGTPDFAVPVLDKLIEMQCSVSLVVTQPDRPKGRKKILTAPPVKEAAIRHGLPVFQPEKIKNEYKQVQDAAPDIIVTAAFGQILPKEVLEIPKLGAINVHASLLPKYRGGAPIHQSIIDGEKETGITIMYMVEKLDAGDMLMQRAIPIEPEDTTGTMHDKLSSLGAEMIEEIIPQLEEGRVSPEMQNEKEVTFAPNIKKEQEIIDWNKTALQVHDQVRGLVPWPVAYTEIGESRFKVWETEVSAESTEAAPGTVLETNGKLLKVACLHGTVIGLKRVQPSGKKPMDIPTFMNGQGKHIEPGIKLGAGNE